MRKYNTILAIILTLLLADHMVFGGLYMLRRSGGVFKPLAIAMVILTVIHAVISMIITVRAEKVGIVTKARYNKENREFWLRRGSGIGILVFALGHAYSMLKNERGIPNISFLPKYFRLALPLLIVSVGVHLMINVRPLLISLGIRKLDTTARIIKILIALLTLFAAVALVIFQIMRARGDLA